MSRHPRFQRVVKAAPIKLTDRDQKIIRLIHRHRFLRSHQIIALIGGSAQNLSRRLQWLFHHGYLERPRAQLQYYERSGSKTIAYGLGNKSGLLLQLNPASWGEKNRAIGRMYLAHALLVSDVMVVLELACRQHGIRLLHEDELNLPIEAPLHWRVKIRDGTKLGVIPDRVFALESRRVSFMATPSQVSIGRRGRTYITSPHGCRLRYGIKRPKRRRKASHPHQLKWNAFRFHWGSRNLHFSSQPLFTKGLFYLPVLASPHVSADSSPCPTLQGGFKK